MANFGEINKLIVNRFTVHGAYLQFNTVEILMPKKYIREGLSVDDEVEVFVYKDSEDRLVAITGKPFAQVGEFAALEVVDITPFGAFLDWGIEKHLLVPKKEMKEQMKIGHKYVVKIVIDYQTERIIGVGKLNTFIKHDADYKQGDEVEGLVVSKSDLGYKLLIESKYWGLLYSNEVFRPISQGESINCFVKKVREDGKIDLLLSSSDEKTRQSDANYIVQLLKMNDGILNLSDKSSPQQIKEIVGLSKKSFKKAIGTLYKQQIIKINSLSISLI